MKTTHGELLNRLVEVLHRKRSKTTGQDFKQVVEDLKNLYGFEISTKYLRGLLSEDLNRRQKTKRVNYLLSISGLETKKAYRYYREWTHQKFKTEIKEFISVPINKVKKENLINVGEIMQHKRITEPHGLTEEEEQQLKEIEEIKQKSGVELVKRAEKTNKEKNRVREVVYDKNYGLAKLKSIRTQTIGREFIGNFSETLFMIVV